MDEKFIPYNNRKHGPYITELKHGFSIFEEVKAPQLAVLGSKDLDSADFTMGISYIDRPFDMVDEGQKHDFPQYYFILGGDFSRLDEFDAEIVFGLEGHLQTITYPSCIRVTPGLFYGPIRFTKIVKPVTLIHILISPTAPPPPKLR